MSEPSRPYGDQSKGMTGPGTPDADYLRRELKYWEAAFDRLKTEFAALKKSHDDWKQGYDNLAVQTKQWEEWNLDKEREIGRLNSWLTQLNQTVDVWKSDHKKLVALVAERDKQLQHAAEIFEAQSTKAAKQVGQWESWYKSMEKDRDLYRQWDADKKSAMEQQGEEIRQLNNRIDLLLDHPLHYIKSFLRWKFKKQK
jgi:chromosome segregation ATPase